MDVLRWGSYLRSSHSSVNVDTPTPYNDRAILVLKVFWFSIHSHFECTNTPLPTCARCFSVPARFSTGLIRHKQFPGQIQQKKYKTFKYQTGCTQTIWVWHAVPWPATASRSNERNWGEICGSKKWKKNTTEQSFSYHGFSKTTPPATN